MLYRLTFGQMLTFVAVHTERERKVNDAARSPANEWRNDAFAYRDQELPTVNDIRAAFRGAA